MSDPHETLARIRKQADAATEGPWRYVSIFEVGGYVEDGRGRELFDWAQDDAGTICTPDADAEFIAAARTNVPHLVDALDAVLKVHQPFTWDFGYGPLESCKGCADQGAGDHDYPCPTVTAITTALEGDPQ